MAELEQNDVPRPVKKIKIGRNYLVSYWLSHELQSKPSSISIFESGNSLVIATDCFLFFRNQIARIHVDHIKRVKLINYLEVIEEMKVGKLVDANTPVAGMDASKSSVFSVKDDYHFLLIEGVNCCFITHVLHKYVGARDGQARYAHQKLHEFLSRKRVELPPIAEGGVR